MRSSAWSPRRGKGGATAFRDVALGSADWLVVVAFSEFRPVTLWAAASARIPRLLTVLGLDTRGESDVIDGGGVGCARVHDAACRYAGLALAHGVSAYHLSADGSCREGDALTRDTDGRNPLRR